VLVPLSIPAAEGGEARRPQGAARLGYAAQRFNACFLIKIALPATQSLRPVM